MPNHDEIDYSGGAITAEGAQAYERTFVARVYGLMFLGLALTGVTALACTVSDSFASLFFAKQTLETSRGIVARYSPTAGYWVATGVELLIWLAFVFAGRPFRAAVALPMFFAFAFCNGVFLFVPLIIYTASSVAAAFLVTAGTFGVFALYGHFTKHDLTTIGSLCFMGFIGLLVAALVNLFIGSAGLGFLINLLFVPVLVGLVAWKAQWIKELAACGIEGTEEDKGLAVYAALGLYISFLNLLWIFIRLFGQRR
jgi:hypothetical protein